MPQLRTGHAKAEDGTRIAYQVSGDGQPLLLLAGQSNNHSWWQPVRAGFEEQHTVITLDYRGTGDSDKPDSPYSVELFADDAAAVLDDLNIDRADVYGTSMGGRTAQWLAINHPRRVRRLVLGCTSPGGRNAVPRDNEVGRRLGQSPESARELLIELMYPPQWRAANPGPYPVLGDDTMPPHARRHHLVASHRHDAWHRLPEITAPTLILHGSDDRMTPVANAELLKQRIPGSRVLILDGARHAYFHERAAEATPAVLHFLSN